MDLGAIAGWASVILGQLVSWPQVLKLRRERGDGVSLASYAIVNVSMTLFFLHAIAIGDVVSVASVPVSMVPNIVIATTLLRRRRLRDRPPTLCGREDRMSTSQPDVIGAGGIARSGVGSPAARRLATHNTPRPNIDARTHTSPPTTGIRPRMRRIAHPSRKARKREGVVFKRSRPMAWAPAT